jgi:TPR repeat protein
MMKRLISAVVLCGCSLAFVCHPAMASYFDGMEAYRQSDYQTAMREFKAVEDDARALYMIGVMHEKGEGVTVDLTDAANWFRKAADKGNASAQYRLGRLYERGLGVEQNRDEAISWYKKSARNGNIDARQALKRMEAK